MAQKLLARARLIAQLVGYGASPADSCRILAAYLRAWLLPKFGRVPLAPWQANVRMYGRTVTLYFREYCDFCVFEEIFIKEEYAQVQNRSLLPIIDAGANVGFTALYFASRFPGVPIYAFEPDPGAYALLVKNAAAFPEITPVPAALGEKDGEATFYSVPGSAMSSSFVKRANGTPVTVPVRSLASWLEKHSIEKVGVLKIDVEGFEDRIIEGIRDTGAIEEYIAEVHFDLMQKGEAWFRSMLEGHILSFEYRGTSRAIMYARRP